MLISLTSTCFFSHSRCSKTKKRAKVLVALLAGGGYEKRRAGSFAKEVSSTYLCVFLTFVNEAQILHFFSSLLSLGEHDDGIVFIIMFSFDDDDDEQKEEEYFYHS